MIKYQKLFFQRTEHTFQKWSEYKAISNQELYRFLHSLKGTAASIGLFAISEIATEKIAYVSEREERQWSYTQWNELLKELIQIVANKRNLDCNDGHSTIQKTIETNDSNENNPLLLVVDDDIHLLSYLKEELEKDQFMVLGAVNAERAIDLFYEQKPDCVVVDIQLPDRSGLDVLEIIMEKAKAFFIPVIAISAYHDKLKRIQAYKIGVVDFIEKPFDYDEFLIRIRNRLEYKEMISQAILIDELTGIFNRRFFNFEMLRQLQEIGRTNESFSLVLMDLDHFKRINDKFGHNVGDDVLVGFASFINERKRYYDYLIRYGGEEFILLLPKTNAKQAQIVTERLLWEFSKYTFSAEDVTFFVTFSAGIIEVSDPSINTREYLKWADQALYQAKKTGRNRICVCNQFDKHIMDEKIIHIGIIDDDPIVHQLLQDQLSQLSCNDFKFDIKAFFDGNSFFSSDWVKQKNGKFLILLDGILPNMDGLEILQKIRKEYGKDEFIIVMLTGRKEEQDIVRALELGADDYLTKPFSISELKARIKRLVFRILV